MKVYRSKSVKIVIGIIALAAAIGAGFFTAQGISVYVNSEERVVCYDGKGNEITPCDVENINRKRYNPEDGLYLAYENLMDYYFRYISNANIEAGNLVDEKALGEAEERFVKENNLSSEKEKMQDLASKISKLEAKEELDEEETKELEGYREELVKVKEVYDATITPLIEAYKNTLIREQIAEFEKITKTYLEDTMVHYVYVIYTVEGNVISNIEGSININDFKNYTMNDSYTLGYSIPLIGEHSVADTPTNVSEVHIAMKEDYYALVGDRYTISYEIDEVKQAQMMNYFYYAIACCLGFVICAIYLMVVAGRIPSDDELHILGIDHVYSDMYLIIVATLWGVGCVSAEIIAKSYRDGYIIYPYFLDAFMGLAGILGVITLLYLTTSAKHVKQHDFFRYSLIGSILSYIINGVRGIGGRYINIDESVKKKFTRIVGLVVILNIICGGMYFGFAELALEVSDAMLIGCIFLLVMGIINFVVIRFMLMKYAEEMEVIHRGTKIIAGGNLDYKIPALSDETLDTIAEDINSISSGLKESMSESLASERTKIELITNVSHDLKTPLTSIISYVDLLSRSSDEEEKKHYLDILQLKSNQLKKLVDDLFEITKIQNGQISVELGNLCMDDLLTQALAEYDEAFVKKHLSVRYSPLEEKTMVHADGNKMYRVVSNLLGNIVKYSLEGTRVYIDFHKDDEYLHVEFKNIANYEMNFDVNEISQRFKRGDDARSSEGNGLGLAIADSFMNIQSGSIDVGKDGDLFKVCVHIPLAK